MQNMSLRSRIHKLTCLWGTLGLLACKDIATVGSDASTKHDAAMPIDAASSESDAGGGGEPDARVDAQASGDGDAAVGSAIKLSGAAEKGPLVLGSSVSVSAVDQTGVPTGQVFNTQTTDDLGHFELLVQHQGIVALEASGYYFNEVTGKLSGAPITLRGWYELSRDSGQTANINVLTHLTNRRVLALLQGGSRLTQAVAQAEGELVQTLGIGSSAASAATSLDVASSAYLFALSAVTAQAALISGGESGADAALQELLNKIAVDLADDGAVSTVFHGALAVAEDTLDVATVTDQLATRLGTSVPDLNTQLDSDLDGLLNSDDNCLDVANFDQQDTNGDGVGDACCGNGSIEGDEECDDGALNGATKKCTPVCTTHRCGDSYPYSGSEACDDGNSTNGDDCDTDCTLPHCGDGAVNGNEACDDGNSTNGDGCDINCTASGCGNGVLAPNEQCDDGNLTNADGCEPDCTNSALVIEMASPSIANPPMRNGQFVAIRVWAVDNGQTSVADVESVSINVANLDQPLKFEDAHAYWKGSIAIDAATFEVVVTVVQHDASIVQRGFSFTFDPVVNTTPMITKVTPRAVAAGGDAFSLSITGHADDTAHWFVPGSVAYCDDTALVTTFKGLTSVEAAVPAGLIASPGLHQITLKNPGASGASSNGVPLSVSEHVPPRGAWTVTGGPSESRSDLSLTLSNGMVLLILADTGRSPSAMITDLYDPDTGTWNPSTSLNIFRYSLNMFRYDGSSAILLGNGQVLAAGGTERSNAPGPSAETRDPTTATWTLTGPMAVYRSRFAMSLLHDGTALATGGYDPRLPDDDTDLRSAERYDPNTRSWTAVHDMFYTREGHTQTTLVDGKVLVAGGRIVHDAVWPQIPSETMLPVVEVYDPVEDKWTYTGELLTPRANHIALALPNGKVLVLGGTAGGPEVYDPGTAAWTDAGETSKLTSVKGAVLLNSGLVFAIGTGDDGPLSTELYDLATGFWYPATPMPSPYDLALLQVLPSGKVLATTTNATAHLFDPTVP